MKKRNKLLKIESKALKRKVQSKMLRLRFKVRSLNLLETIKPQSKSRKFKSFSKLNPKQRRIQLTTTRPCS